MNKDCLTCAGGGAMKFWTTFCLGSPLSPPSRRPGLCSSGWMAMGGAGVWSSEGQRKGAGVCFGGVRTRERANTKVDKINVRRLLMKMTASLSCMQEA